MTCGKRDFPGGKPQVCRRETSGLQPVNSKFSACKLRVPYLCCVSVRLFQFKSTIGTVLVVFEEVQ